MTNEEFISRFPELDQKLNDLFKGFYLDGKSYKPLRVEEKAGTRNKICKEQNSSVCRLSTRNH